jgi:hypothetical protein
MSHLALALALLAPLLGARPHLANTALHPVCRATLVGRELVTTFQLANGYRVEGRWTLLAMAPRTVGEGVSEHQADLQLEKLVETDPVGGRWTVMPLALQFRLRVAAADQVDVLKHAIGAWCWSLQRADEAGVHFRVLLRTVPGRRV